MRKQGTKAGVLKAGLKGWEQRLFRCVGASLLRFCVLRFVLRQSEVVGGPSFPRVLGKMV